MSLRFAAVVFFFPMASCVSHQSAFMKNDLCEGAWAHLHLYGAAKEAKSHIAKAMRNNGVKFCFRSNDYPGNAQVNFLIYTEGEEGVARSRTLVTAIESVGIKIDRVYREAFGEHYYTEGNVGVYLFDL